jgi:serine/threonine-protein kinase
VSDHLQRIQAALAGRYAVSREVGVGGMATVYLADDLRHHRDVAIKVLRPELSATLGPERFHREIEIAARLQHPHILGLLDSGAADGFLYYVMPFIEGESLRDRLKRSRELPVPEAVRILRDVVDALAYAHAKGVVHRDIKPENVMLSGRHALVTDFGVAKAVSAAADAGTITTAGVALGTPAYMSPEQATADPLADHRADLYSVGAMAYELITGAPPFADGPAQMILARHVTETPKPIAEQRPIQPALAGLVMRALEKRPADRFQSADEMLAILEGLATPSGGTTPTDTRPTRAHPARRRVVLPVGVALAVVAIAALSWLGLGGRGGAAPAAPAARDPMPSVGVLPFTEINQPAGQEYFADGLTEEVIGALSRMPSLRVPGRASSMHFKGSGSPVRAIAESLQVRSLLTASIQRQGNRVRIRADLVNAADGFQLWSETYDESLENLFAVYDTVARSIARALKVRLTVAAEPRAAAPPRKGTSAAAYNAYLIGRYHLNRRTSAGVDSALLFFRQAIAADSGYALAWSGLADAYTLATPSQYQVAGISGEVALDRALAAARRAVDLAPTSGEARTSLAHVHAQRWEWRESAPQWARALQLDPNYAPLRHWYGTELVAQGRLDEALAEFRRAEELDPLFWIAGVWTALTLSAGGNHDAAARKLDALIAGHPGNPRVREEAGLIALRRGDFERAALEYGMALELSGDSTLARRARSELPRPELRERIGRDLAIAKFAGQGGPRGVDIAMYTGARALGLELLERLPVTPGDVGAPTLRAAITHPELRQTATWREYLRRMGVR